MNYENLKAKLAKNNLGTYVKNHLGKVYSDTIKILEQIPDSELDAVVDTGDVISSIKVERVNNEFLCTFYSSLNDENYHEIHISKECIPNSDTLLTTGEYAKIYLEPQNVSFYLPSSLIFGETDFKIKKILGDAFISKCARDQSFVVKESFFIK